MIPVVETRQDRAAFYGSHEWKAKRLEILERDNYECAWCKIEGRVTSIEHSRLDVDHIIELKDRPDLALDSSSLRILCADCHNKRHKRFNYRPRKKENAQSKKFPESFK